METVTIQIFQHATVRAPLAFHNFKQILLSDLLICASGRAHRGQYHSIAKDCSRIRVCAQMLKRTPRNKVKNALVVRGCKLQANKL